MTTRISRRPRSAFSRLCIALFLGAVCGIGFADPARVSAQSPDDAPRGDLHSEREALPAPSVSSPCLDIRLSRTTFTNNGETSYDANIANSCGARVWWKACYIGADAKYHRDSGFVDADDTEKTYLLVSGSATPGSFRYNEGSRSDSVLYPSACAPRGDGDDR